MQKLMLVDHCKKNVDDLMPLLEAEYEVLLYKNSLDAMGYLNDEGCEKICGILLNLDDPDTYGRDLLVFLRDFAGRNQIPTMIMTRNVLSNGMEEAFTMGAEDYWIIGAPPELLIKRLRDFVKPYFPGLQLMTQPENSRARNFLFEKCIGAAMFLQYDGETLQPLLINDKFYEVARQDRRKFAAFQSNLFASIHPDDLRDYRRGLDEALKTGVGTCQMRNPETGQTLRVALRHVGRNEYGDVLFALIDDVTDSLRILFQARAIVELPGSWIYDYDPAADRIMVTVSDDNGARSIVVEQFLGSDKTLEWLAPESVKIFRDTFSRASERQVSGYVDFKGKFFSKKSIWYRGYYKSIGDCTGRIYRVVGRAEELSEAKAVNSSLNTGSIFDTTTRLLTYHAIREFIAKSLGEKNRGTMLVLAIEELDRVAGVIGQDRVDSALAGITRALCQMFKEGDIIGRFGQEGFVIFLPEVYSYHLAQRKAEEVLALLDRCKKRFENMDEPSVAYIGAAVDDHEDIDVGELLQRANVARWKAKEDPEKRYYIIHRESGADPEIGTCQEL